MFKHTRRTLAAAAFCFGLALSFGAFAQYDCQACTDACYEQYEQCNSEGYPFCKQNLRACIAACGCRV